MDFNIELVLKELVESGGTDIFLVTGSSISIRKNGEIVHLDAVGFENAPLKPADTREIISMIYKLANDRSMDKLNQTGDDDFAFALNGVSRFRINAYRQRGTLSAVIRVIPYLIPNPDEINIPKSIIELGNIKKGLVLVTGPAGSGKSTTLACILDAINNTRNANIITLEDPIEYLHKHKQSLISQREIPDDTVDYMTGLKTTLRQSPDVIMLGEMRDYETISIVLNASETGHLLFSTLHTIGAANSINRVIDVFPSDQQKQVSLMLSMVLTAVVSQQLVPSTDGGMIPVFEIMMNTPAIGNLIRSGKVYQIDSVIASERETMVSMDDSLLDVYRRGLITKETALKYAINPDMLERKL
ncbi:MAG: PilT/PilU family type 4a pilus ATPase [Lachnospiraceae bacterium]|nr:PilT/PilU family type 4a pilus ATPase [Lachnospiraceae bacterium]